MAHDHHHHDHGGAARDYFTEQLLTIFVVGLFGAVAVLLYRSGRLEFILAKEFRLPVLIGGLAILALVVIRGVCVWREAGQARADAHHHHHEHGPDCDHSHDHGHTPHDHTHSHGHHDHDHGHAHHAHAGDDHGHSHDMAWVFARMLVLFFPVALFLIGVPNSGFSKGTLDAKFGDREQSLGNLDLGEMASRGEMPMSFRDLNDAGADEGKRSQLEGQTAVLTGMFRRLGDKEFTLFRLRMTCCATDALPLKVRIVVPQALSGFNDYDWVQVRGQVRFIPIPEGNSTRYIPVIKVADVTNIQKTRPLSDYE